MKLREYIEERCLMETADFNLVLDWINQNDAYLSEKLNHDMDVLIDSTALNTYINVKINRAIKKVNQ